MPATFGGALLLAVVLSMEARAEEGCRQNQDLPVKISTCTGLLAVDGSIGPNAWALVERANGWCRSGETEAAIEDIWSWFEEDRTAIARMQGKLAELGFYGGAIDGGYSAGLDQAVIAWA